MHCLSCDKILNDAEAAVKFTGWEKIKNPEDRYMNLCSKCLYESDLREYDFGLDNTEQVDQELIPLEEL